MQGNPWGVGAAVVVAEGDEICYIEQRKSKYINCLVFLYQKFSSLN
jgi:hypothetical protein